ncbi:barstar family protein [Streptosporangium sp. NPDC051023]|uniref:barstar family protein n=1 Tax=Streptosporangium sp. NPDC051023 TaxID=3155410 RepID=UPI00344B59B9
MPRGTFEEGSQALETLHALRASGGAGVARAPEITEVSETARITRVTEVPEVPGVTETVETARGTAFTHRIDGSEITTSAEAMTAIAEALSFPDYFGHNLDALYDCLTDLAWLPAGEHLLIWSRPSVLRDADPAAYEAIRAVLADAVADDTPGESFLSVLLPDG